VVPFESAGSSGLAGGHAPRRVGRGIAREISSVETESVIGKCELSSTGTAHPNLVEPDRAEP